MWERIKPDSSTICKHASETAFDWLHGKGKKKEVLLRHFYAPEGSQEFA